jgi:hypothetical protein
MLRNRKQIMMHDGEKRMYPCAVAHGYKRTGATRPAPALGVASRYVELIARLRPCPNPNIYKAKLCCKRGRLLLTRRSVDATPSAGFPSTHSVPPGRVVVCVIFLPIYCA